MVSIDGASSPAVISRRGISRSSHPVRYRNKYSICFQNAQVNGFFRKVPFFPPKKKQTEEAARCSVPPAGFRDTQGEGTAGAVPSPRNPGRGVGPRPYQIFTPLRSPRSRSVQRPHGEDTTSGFCVPFHLVLMSSKKCSDVVWSPEISVQHLRAKFDIEYGTSIEGFLNSAYLAGADLNGRTLSTARPLRPSVRYCGATLPRPA